MIDSGVMSAARYSVFARFVWAAVALTVVLVAFLWWSADRTIRAEQEQALARAVDIDLAGLVDIYATGGEGELRRRIADRLALAPAGSETPHYLLLDRDAGRLAGDLDELPPLDPAVSEAGPVALDDGATAFGRATRLSPDLDLVVARENTTQRKLLADVRQSFLIGGLAAVLLVAGIGWLAAQRLKRRIARINAAFRDPQSDNLSQDTTSPQTRGDEIDELMQHTAQLLARQLRLATSYRDMSDQLAHEIRTPLMHLDTRLVKALGTDPAPELAERLVEARAEIKRLVRTLESLLDISASNARRGDPHGLAKVDLSTIAQRICELYADTADESGHRFEWFAPDGIVVDGEESSLARLITNLLDNAFKYVPPGGAISFALEPGPVIDVTDDGPGVPEHARERIFNRFHRVARGESESIGSGLGLALARAIAERHGWKLVLLPSANGAHFHVSPEET